jgi:hypothetical protein|tara:strand:- start:89 stop:397 length:309 start_codon:yes stop_codon:yes gene_type:complete
VSPKEHLNTFLNKLGNNTEKKVEPEFTQSKDEVGEFMSDLMNDAKRSNYNYNKKLVKMEFDPQLKDVKQSIVDLNTRLDTKLDEDKMKKGMTCFNERSCFDI